MFLIVKLLGIWPWTSE